MAEWTTIRGGVRLYQPRAPAVSRELLQNWYAEPGQEGAKRAITIYPTPGLKLWADLGSDPVRGVYEFGSDLYVVAGETLYVIDLHTRAVTTLGEVGGSGAVRMIDNGTHVAVATSHYCYAANRSGGVIWLPIQYISGLAYQDGYVIFAQRGTQNFWLSGLDDLTTVSALDFSTADAFPDNIVGCISDHRTLLLFGEETTEGWYNSGDAAFPFARTGGGFIEQGCKAPGSIAKAKRRVFFLGNDRTVYQIQGFNAEPISTTDIEALIANASDPQAAEAYCYTQAGHTYYVISFGDLTLSYDLGTGLWHKRKSWGMDRWRVQGAADVNGTVLVGCCTDGRIFELDLETYDEDGEVIEREMQLPPISAGARPMFFGEMLVDVDAGVGVVDGQGSDPQLLLDWSEDDGRTFGNAISASVGAVGEYRHETRYNRLGMSRSRTFRLRGSDPVNYTILGIEARMEPGV